jgi:uncharacterized protein YnzC (UPF0291/DUF896 family)
MPDPKGFIAVCCNKEKAAKCELGGSTISQLAANHKELVELIKIVDVKDMTPAKRPPKESDVQFEAAHDTKKFNLEKGDSYKEASINAGLSPK